MEESCDGDHKSTVNEAWKSATSNSKEPSEYLYVQKQYSSKKESV